MRATRTQDAANLARKAGLNAATVWRLMKSERDTISPRPETLRAIERASGILLPPELAAIAGHPGHDASQLPQHGMAEPNLPYLLPPSGVPVHALLGTRVDGMFHRNAEPFEAVARPPGLAGRLKVFALRMPDDSMTPWRRPNELIFVDPTWTVAAGDHALVEVNNGADPNGQPLFLVRRFVGLDRRTGQIRLGRYGAEGPVVESMRRDHVPSMQRVLEWTEVMGA